MKILHYSLGLPSFVKGGLPKYSNDLMCEQIKLGHEIILLYPGEYTLTKKTKIISMGIENGIKIYKIDNPQLVTLHDGIGEPPEFYKACVNKKVYDNFIKNIKPDILHIHSLIGVHKEFVEIARENAVKTIFTTHDYFGLCPKINLLDYKNEICTNYENGEKCAICNSDSCSSKHIYFVKSRLYKNLKSNKFCYGLFKKLKSRKNNIIIENSAVTIDNAENIRKSKDYVTLRSYYLDIFRCIDYFHFNSNVSKNEFKRYIDVEGQVISIAHGDIEDRRVKKNYTSNKELRLTYLGPIEIYKGFYLLKEALEILKKNGGLNWSLNVFGSSEGIESDNSKIIFNGSYDYKSLKDIFQNTDLVIVPSIWKETFGFIGLEALSYGIPVMVTDNVGMQDIIDNNVTGIIVKQDASEISEGIKKIMDNREILNEINDNILKMKFEYTMEMHAGKIIDLYKKVINRYGGS